MIVQMVQMKILRFVIIVIVIRIHSLNVKMENAFRNYGFVILMMIAVMVQMNQLIDVEIGTVARVGRNVLQEIIIVAFPVGYFVMVKMIVVTILMKQTQSFVLNVMKLVISNAKMEDVYH